MIKQSEGIELKKKFGQHFLRDANITRIMIDAVHLDNATSVLEIGCGDGFLTRAILTKPIKQLWSFDIDPEWVDYVRQTVSDDRLHVFEENILAVDFTRLEPEKPWVVLANLPYQITFPILFLLMKHHDLFREGVVMVQEEVAQKIVKSGGRGFGFSSLFLQYYAQWKLLTKIPPTAFFPAPKIHSRLLYFNIKSSRPSIEQEEQFWKFVKTCFLQPRRTLKNNLQQSLFDLSRVSQETLQLRAQQMSFDDLLTVWRQIIA